MSMIALRCPNCHGEVQFDEKLETGFCMYCGSKIVNEKAIASKISFDREGEIKGLLELGKIAFQKEDYVKAELYSDDVIKIDSFVADAWLIKSSIPANGSYKEEFLSKAKATNAKTYGIFSEADCEQGFLVEFQFDRINTHSYGIYFKIDRSRKISYAPNSKTSVRIKPGPHVFQMTVYKESKNGYLSGDAKPINFVVEGDCKYRVKDGITNIKLIKL